MVSNKNSLTSYDVGAFFYKEGIVFLSVFVVDVLEDHPRGNVCIVLVLQYYFSFNLFRNSTNTEDSGYEYRLR